MNLALIGVIILVLASIGDVVLANRNATDRPRQIKILLFALYFWGLAFAQLMLVAIS